MIIIRFEGQSYTNYTTQHLVEIVSSTLDFNHPSELTNRQMQAACKPYGDIKLSNQRVRYDMMRGAPDGL